VDDQFNEFYQMIGERIRDLRIQKGMSQADLAEKAHLSLPVISSIENARSKVWLVTFAKIAEALQVSADDILRLNTPEASLGYPKEMTELFAQSLEKNGLKRDTNFSVSGKDVYVSW